MLMPHLEFIYRIVAEMDKGGVTEIKGVDSTAKSRIVLPIQGSHVLNRPQIKGIIVEKSGADWAEVINPNKFVAPGDSFYGWLNSIVAIGAMIMSEGRPVIDCYRLTKFPGKRAANL
ncbi:hypothetical protein FOVG_17714 [Fusarium oxysporum f. sp. pisi HDV247]|uniref:Uncharacterized protein n=1 Tax=Fusarium oxysporum f. sp. pisi HDV247 TaxID=1080344 RepID=W9NLS4_FUSOX|nr:hypothetical protein FOVG_17714 [Fusarium oxysporum f. sp. pisi HDV247]